MKIGLVPRQVGMTFFEKANSESVEIGEYFQGQSD
jgi:hypothetical protein